MRPTAGSSTSLRGLAGAENCRRPKRANYVGTASKTYGRWTILAEHQRLFLDRVLLDDDNFYSAVMVFRNGEMVKYIDGDKSIAVATGPE